MCRLIYNIENRGDVWIYHWFLYMIAGLKYIECNKPVRNGLLEQNANLYNKDIINSKPFLVCFNNIDTFISYQKDTFNLLSDFIKVININDINNSDIIINNYGESTNIPHDSIIFLRKLFLDRINIIYDNISNNIQKYIYIRRDKSHFCEGNKNDNYIKRRQIINENELCHCLSQLNFSCIYLEDFNLLDKIKIFQTANIIISPSSGALTMLLFANLNLKIFELNTKNPHQISDQYKNICKVLNISHYFYNDVIKVDSLDNMKVNIEHFINYFNNIIT